MSSKIKIDGVLTQEQAESIRTLVTDKDLKLVADIFSIHFNAVKYLIRAKERKPNTYNVQHINIINELVFYARKNIAEMRERIEKFEKELN